MRTRHLLLLGILALGASLRFARLDWGLRHTPHLDEQYFVENVRGMLARGDLDHRFHEYPGLVFYLLLPAVAAVDRTTLAPEGYLAARAVVAAFGVGAVGLLYLLGSRLSRPAGGLAAALLGAVSPVAVQTAHWVRPDVVLEFFALLALLVTTRIGRDPRRDAAAGALVGIATAVKFSGVLLAPSYLLQRALRPGGGWWRPVLAGGAAVGAYAICSPYTLLDFDDFLSGAWTQLDYHYQERGEGPQAYWGTVFTYARTLLKALGPVGLALAGAGLILARREWRTWAPLVLYPLLSIAVFSTAEVHHDRFLLPALGVPALLAGLAVAAADRRLGPVAAVPAVVAAAFPLVTSVAYLRDISVPGTRDLAVEWIAARLPPGGRVLSTLPELGLDAEKYEVLAPPRIHEARVAARHVDFVVTTVEGAAALGLESRHSVEPGSEAAGPPIVVGAVPAARRPGLRPLALSAARLTSSEAADALPALVDGSLQTLWTTRAPQRPGTWLEVRFPAAARVASVELALGRKPRHYARNLHLFAWSSRGAWQRVAVTQGRPPLDRQRGGPGARSQVLLFDPVETEALRLVQSGRRLRPWSIAELKILVDETPQPVSQR